MVISPVQYPLPQLNSHCTSCERLVKSRKRITFGWGNIHSKVMFVGEAPGYKGCDVTGIPFTQDNSGEFFQSMLSFVGWTKNDVYVTNIVKCCPPGNDEPTPTEITNCITFLQYEIAKVNPAYIVLMGKPAMKVFFPNIPSIISAWDKQRILDGRTYILIPHPAYIIRNRKLTNYYKSSFLKIKELVDGIR